MPRPNTLADVLVRSLAGLAGGAMLYAAGLAALQAKLHMATVGMICGSGPQAPHCAWCAASVGLALAGVFAMSFCARPVPAPARVS